MLARLGVRVELVEMKPRQKSPAHRMDTLCELVCSNSLKAEREDSAAGILKREMRKLGSLVMRCAEKTRVAAGGALAVDRVAFSQMATQLVGSHPLISVVCREVTDVPSGDVIIATGPLTSGRLFDCIAELTGEPLSFYDAAAPIVHKDGIDMAHAFFGGRYDQPEDYLNCPLDREGYDAFYAALLSAERAPQRDFETGYYEGCMPIEVIASRGYKTPLFGPMSPKGIVDPKTKRRPYALVQLRREDAAGTMWNLVGFQTNLKFPEQKRVFGMIPALKNAQYVRFGVMHRNTFLPSRVLDSRLSHKANPRIRFAGQITGVEGYLESAATGMLAGLYTGCALTNRPMPVFHANTAMGALLSHVSAYEGSDYQPMGINFALMATPEEPDKGKKLRHQRISIIAEQAFRKALADCGMEEEQ
jgi:methylenetetrahydrofolate--tRNA-(uracil-5-)-methyltransferase